MGIWKDIRHALNSTLGTSSFIPLDKKIDDVMSGGVKIIKSIQRGILSAGTTSVTINSVVADKCFVILNNELVSYTYVDTYVERGQSSSTFGSLVSSLTSNKLTITANTSSDSTKGRVSWQVIEFY